MYSIAAPVIGAFITIMNGINSRFSALVGALPAALTIHLVGFFLISGILIVKRLGARLIAQPVVKPGRLPFYLYLGGVAGVGTVFSCNYAYSALDASLAVALGLIGQTGISIAADAFGFLGQPKRPVTVSRAPGIILAILGAAIIAREWRTDLIPISIALGSGLCIGLNALLNAEHGRRNGTANSAQWNYITGLSLTTIIVMSTKPEWSIASEAVANAGLVLAMGGAFFGVIIVMSLNTVFTKLPAFRATLLLFSGQALMGVLLDAYTSGYVDLRKLAGTVVVLCGLALDGLVHRQGIARPAT